MTTQNNDLPTPNTCFKPATFEVKDNVPYIGGVNLLELTQSHGTPLFVMDEVTIRQMAQAYQGALKSNYKEDSLPLYASKANLTMGLARLVASEGMGLDVVSGGELYTAINAGFPVDRIYFNSNNKSLEELEFAIENDIFLIGVDNFYELTLIDKVAAQKGKKVDVLLRIAPGIECHTHDYIRTGQTDTKFGFDMKFLPEAIEKILNTYKATINLRGLHSHIGSQIFEVKPFEDLVEFMMNVYFNVRDSYGVTLDILNVGGGYGIQYTEGDDPPDVRFAVKTVTDTLKSYAEKIKFPLPRLLMEPGRSMVATAGVTLYTVGSMKTVPDVRKYVAVDGGMGDNIRPALYQAEYTAALANKLNKPNAETVRVVGKYCESGDVLIREVSLPEVESGDTLIVFGTGAYNYSMASNYNRIGRPAMVLVENGKAHTLVRRETYEDMARLDEIPAHLNQPALV